MKKKSIFSFNTYVIVGMALFAALSAVNKIIPYTDTLRISLENTPIILAAIAYGPIAGAIVGGIADLLGCFSLGIPINPIITLGATSIGFISGISYLIVKKFTNKTILHSIFSVIPAHILGSIIIKTTGIYIYSETPLIFTSTLFSRLIIYTIISIAEIIIIQSMFKTKLLDQFKKNIFRTR